VKDGVRFELVKLHTINKKKPTKKFVGRKRKTMEKEGEEHHPITARGLRDPLGAWKLDGVLGRDEAIRSSLLHLPLLDSRAHPIGCGVRILFLGHDILRCKMLHAHLQSTPGGSMRKDKYAEIGNGGGGGEEELVNSENPTLPLYTFSAKERGLRHGKRSGSGSPLTGRKNSKLPRYP
jgi:hypothetical protein